MTLRWENSKRKFLLLCVFSNGHRKKWFYTPSPIREQSFLHVNPLTPFSPEEMVFLICNWKKRPSKYSEVSHRFSNFRNSLFMVSSLPMDGSHDSGPRESCKDASLWLMIRMVLFNSALPWMKWLVWSDTWSSSQLWRLIGGMVRG